MVFFSSSYTKQGVSLFWVVQKFHLLIPTVLLTISLLFIDAITINRNALDEIQHLLMLSLFLSHCARLSTHTRARTHTQTQTNKHTQTKKPESKAESDCWWQRHYQMLIQPQSHEIDI
jgi:hypothetical protein